LKNKALPPIEYLDICGWLWLSFKRKKSNQTYNYKVYYEHGSGGNAPVTEGLIAAKRGIIKLDGVDLFVMGHVHKNWSVIDQRININMHGNVECRPVRLICTGTHQKTLKEPNDKNLSWSEMKAFPPSTMGGAFHHLFVKRDVGITARIEH
jgi:hypothetical protein